MKISKILCAVLALCLFTYNCFSEEIKRSVIVSKLGGEVMIKHGGPGTWENAKIGDVLTEGSFIKTGLGGRAVLTVDGATHQAAIVDMDEKSLLSFTTLAHEATTGTNKTLLDLAIGQILIKAEKLDTPESKFEVKTPTSVVGVRGTKFSVKVDAVK
ncbi:MAG: FecR family protein [Candidatus Omnitrophica bacterium]|nr:FecR family protein [Candidatus Omnitrophota bacterium]